MKCHMAEFVERLTLLLYCSKVPNAKIDLHEWRWELE